MKVEYIFPKVEVEEGVLRIKKFHKNEFYPGKVIHPMELLNLLVGEMIANLKSAIEDFQHSLENIEKNELQKLRSGAPIWPNYVNFEN